MSGGRNALALVRHGKEFTHYINRKMLSVEITPNHAPRQGDGTLIPSMHRRAIGQQRDNGIAVVCLDLALHTMLIAIQIKLETAFRRA